MSHVSLEITGIVAREVALIAYMGFFALRQHTGEKPFVCNQCSFSCKEASKMRMHKLTHTGEKPLACKKCDYSCRQPRDLRNHMKRHISVTSNPSKWLFVQHWSILFLFMPSERLHVQFDTITFEDQNSLTILSNREWFRDDFFIHRNHTLTRSIPMT